MLVEPKDFLKKCGRIADAKTFVLEAMDLVTQDLPKLTDMQSVGIHPYFELTEDGHLLTLKGYDLSIASIEDSQSSYVSAYDLLKLFSH